MRFNPPPNWPTPPSGWQPPTEWQPDPSWPAPPPGWQFWIEDLSGPERAFPAQSSEQTHVRGRDRRHSKAKILIGLALCTALVAGIAIFAFVYFTGQKAVALPFTGLDTPDGVAVDSAGNVYVTDLGSKRVLKLAAGTDKVTELPFTGLHSPRDVTVDSAGDIYVADMGRDPGESRVLRLAAGQSNPTELPTAGLNHVTSVAVDADGTVYVTDTLNSTSKDRLLKLTTGEDGWSQMVLPGLEYPEWVTVDSAGNLYADDANRKVVKLASGSSNWTDLIPEDSYPDVGLLGITTDSAGNVYMAAHVPHHGDEPDSSWKVLVLKVAAGTDTVTELPLDDLGLLVDVAVDSDGNIYVTDEENHRVLKLAG